MKSFLVANPKGGVGKSTLATNLAGYFARRGYKVMLGDTDSQQSSREWLKLRSTALPKIGSWEIDPRNSIARPPKETTHAVLDTPAGITAKQLGEVLPQVNRIIVPLQPSFFDILATKDFLEVLVQSKQLRKNNTSVAIVGMRVDARTRAAAELERFLEALNLPAITYLRDTQTYVQAAAHGMTVFDLSPSRGAQDWEQWKPLLKWVEAD
jgi:chromosome partitioning protein